MVLNTFLVKATEMRNVRQMATRLSSGKAPAESVSVQCGAVTDDVTEPVKEYTVEYDVQRMDDVQLKKMRAQNKLCVGQAEAVSALFATRSESLSFDEIDSEADAAIQQFAKLRRMIAMARVALVAVATMVCLAGCARDEKIAPQGETAVESRCANGQCSAK